MGSVLDGVLGELSHLGADGSLNMVNCKDFVPRRLGPQSHCEQGFGFRKITLLLESNVAHSKFYWFHYFVCIN